MPGANPVMVLVVPEPTIFPGLMVQEPLAGKPLRATLPVDKAQVGCVMVPTVGAAAAATTEPLAVTAALQQLPL